MRISDWSSDVCSSDLADVSMPQTVAGAGMTIAVEFQVQLVENRVHQLARRFPENQVGRLESLALSNPLERQDRDGHRLAEADAALAEHLDFQDALAGRFIFHNLAVANLNPR